MQKPSFIHAVFCISILFLWVFLGLFVFNISMHSIILINICWVVLNTYLIDSNVERLKMSFKSAIQHSAGIFLIFILIGAVIAAFIISGAIPTLIYYGLNFISPHAFLPMAMLLCSMMSVAIGTSWGTMGTMGVALMGLATLLHIPLPMTAGAVVSGAYFGDKISPLSDTTILSAHSTETDIYQHIKGLSYSLIPAFVLSLLLFSILSARLILTPHSLSSIILMQQQIKAHFHIGWLALLPMILMLVLSFKKKPVELSMLASIASALGIAVFVQHINLTASLNSLFTGPVLPLTGSKLLDSVLHHGGIQSMLNSMSLTLLILALGGLLESYCFMGVLFEPFIKLIKRKFSLVLATVCACIISNMVLGEAYLSIILMSRAFKKAYHLRGLDNCALSNALEEGCTFSTPLIPWTTSGIFISATLGIHGSAFIFWSVFNWIAPVMFLALIVGQTKSRSEIATSRLKNSYVRRLVRAIQPRGMSGPHEQATGRWPFRA